MKKKNIHLKMFALMVLGMLLTVSCRKNDPEPEPEPEPDTEQTTAMDNNISELIAGDIESMGSQASENGGLSTYKTTGSAALSMAPCATVSLNNKIVTVDFGAGCLGLDGRIRTGKLFFDYSASSPNTAVYYRNPGFAASVTSQNYSVDGYQVNILNKSIRNTSQANANLTWSITANIQITKPGNAGTITWSCNRTKELVNTSDTSCYKGQSVAINWQRAIVKLNGSSSGTNAKNESFTATASNLVRDFNCAPDQAKPKRHPFISGTLNYTPGQRPARLINYGSGTCDQNATITVNGVTYNITLP